MPFFFQPRARLLMFRENLQRETETRVHAHQRRFLLTSLDFNKRSNSREIQYNKKKWFKRNEEELTTKSISLRDLPCFERSKSRFVTEK